MAAAPTPALSPASDLATLLERYYSAAVLAAELLIDHAVAERALERTWQQAEERLDQRHPPGTEAAWIFRLLLEQLDTTLAEPDQTAPDTRFLAPDDLWGGHWQSDVPRCDDAVDARARDLIITALRKLPLLERATVVLRDVVRLDVSDVASLLDLTPEQQRRLLHRGRSAICSAVESDSQP